MASIVRPDGYRVLHRPVELAGITGMRLRVVRIFQQDGLGVAQKAQTDNHQDTGG
jgi:hypothetical protein